VERRRVEEGSGRLYIAPVEGLCRREGVEDMSINA
jgi:hypothetical protein